MISAGEVVLGFTLMIGAMFVGLHVAVAIMGACVLGALVYLGPALLMSYGTQLWSTMNSFLLTAIPLFVLLGEILLRSGITGRMYDGLSGWLGRLPGGLLHTNIAASGVFSAVSGSSVATAATIGTVALPALRERAYSERLVLGSIAAGGTLGILIPPSINLIVYGALANASIGQLFAAGILPGVLLVGLFLLTIAALCAWRPAFAGTAPAEQRRSQLAGIASLAPPLAIFLAVMGSIYGGWATPTEAAAVGVVMALAFAAANRTLKIAMLHAAFAATVRTTAMILLIITSAFFLNFVIGVMGVPRALTQFVASLGTSPEVFVWLMVPFYLLLGCFLETMAMMVATVPIIVPLLLHLGIDPVWFGIFLVLMMELSLITPPVGLNLYVVQGVRGRGPVSDVFIGVMPFIATLMVMVVLVILFPRIVTVVPDLLYGRP
ncbi:TRAP transporter large permease [Acuticoccus sp.]|uniref:TRAP transporter large permease n=1 Tax=Acuticoccus sp. TaxID=1904378 RepID=UPI003B51B4CD